MGTQSIARSDQKRNQTCDQRRDLRREMTGKRRALSIDAQALAATALLINVQALPEIQTVLSDNSRDNNTLIVGAYLAVGGEIDLAPTLAWMHSMGITTVLPVIRQADEVERLLFAPYTSTTVLRTGRFNILEPDTPDDLLLSAERLNIVLVPLVSFDDRGNRLGMGGGFYDRTFSYRRNSSPDEQLFVGVSHELQKTGSVPIESWDIPLDIVLTDSCIYHPAGS